MCTTPAKDNRGFTLIELLIVIAIIGFLMATILIAIDPVKRIQDSRDARRAAEVNAILHAILTKQVDDGRLFNGLDSAPLVTTGEYSQVIVTDLTGINCTSVSTRPGCDRDLDISGTATCVAKIDGQLTGTVSSSGTAVIGVGTNFLNETEIDDVIFDATGITCTVTAIASSTSLTCSSAPSPAFSGESVWSRLNGIVPIWIGEIPIDPRGIGTAPCNSGSSCDTLGNLALGPANSGYYIQRSAGDRIQVGACSPERKSTIDIKR